MAKLSRVFAWVGVVLILVGTVLPGSLKAWATARLGEVERTASDGVSVERGQSDTEAERNQATESVLDSLVLDFSFGDHRPFRQVLGELSAQTELQFMLHQTAEDGDLTRDTEIEFSAESLRLRTGLDMMLDKYNATFVIRDGLVVIISLDAASDPAFFRRKTFDVENLLQLIIRRQELKQGLVYKDALDVLVPNIMKGGIVCGLPPVVVPGGPVAVEPAAEEVPEPAVEKEADPAIAKPLEGKGVLPAEGQSAVGPANRVPVKITARQIAGELLVDLVQTQVCPDEWFDTGNGDGVIQVVGGVLFVSQSEDALHQVGSMLSELESKLGAIDARAKKE